MAAFMALLLAGCGEEEQVKPLPRELTREAVGNYCGMIVADHPGPKAQLFLKQRADPIWFASVRDAVVFTLLPEEPKDIAAIYVNDMGKATNWDSPEPDSWIEARDAWFVVDSRRTGGMGAPETVPFSDQTAAQAFVAEYGGELVRFDGISPDYVLSPVGEAMQEGMAH